MLPHLFMPVESLPGGELGLLSLEAHLLVSPRLALVKAIHPAYGWSCSLCRVQPSKATGSQAQRACAITNRQVGAVMGCRQRQSPTASSSSPLILARLGLASQ